MFFSKKKKKRDVRLSIIIPILDSHQVFKRQWLHFERIGVPEGTEIIIVDDGSVPPLEYDGPLPLVIYHTNDRRPWTWALARNHGARIAQGDWLIMYDVDHIIDRKLMDMVCAYDGQKVQFKREFGVLKKNGAFTQDMQTLIDYGFPPLRFKTKALSIPPHPNMFAMKREVFWELGGYREDLIEREYPQGEDSKFKGAWQSWVKAGKGQVHTERPTIYMFPNGKICGDVDFDPKGLFHGLTRATESNPYYRKQIKKHGHNRDISNP